MTDSALSPEQRQALLDGLPVARQRHVATDQQSEWGVSVGPDAHRRVEVTDSRQQVAVRLGKDHEALAFHARPSRGAGAGSTMTTVAAV